MKILLVANYLPPYAGGIQFVVDQLARGYVARGHDVVVTGYDALRGTEHGPRPYRVAAMPAWNPLERLSVPVPLFEPVTLRRRTAALIKWADAVHVHGLIYPNTALAVVLAARANVPVIVTEHVGLVATGRRAVDRGQAIAFRRAGRSLAARRCAAVVVLNERVEAELSQVMGSREKIVRIDNGVDTDLFRPADHAERSAVRQRWGFTRPTALFVGRLSRKKGLDLLLAAAALTDRFDVAVCGKDTERLRDAPPNVRVIGLVDQPALATLYQAADLLVLPSDGEGFPLVVQEAMASGLPVVVTDGAVPRTGPHTSTVRTVPRAAAAMVEEVHEMLDRGAAGRERDGAAAREVALAHFDWSVTVDRYLGLLDRRPASVATEETA